MKLDLEADRLTKIQILAMMSLHNDSPSGLEDSSYHLSHAIHDANTSALHIQTTGRKADDQQSYVWWCLWVFDKINSCISGRAIMINDRDTGIARPPLNDPNKNHGLLIWLALGDILVKVIDLYRPTSDHTCTGWEEDFPPFSSVTQPYDFGDLQPLEQSMSPSTSTALPFSLPTSIFPTPLPKQLLTTPEILELFYNIIAILSCRTASPNHPSYARRLHAGNEIQRLVSNGYHEIIPPFPLVPYAVSLSLTVAYRVIRDRNFSSSDPDSITARANLTTRCEILESLSPRYWPADAMAKLGRKALSSLNKPGADKKSTHALARQLDHSVTICRDQNVGPGGTDPNETPASNAHANVNALHVLSSAAARYADGGMNVHAVPLIGIEEAVHGIYDPAAEGVPETSTYTPETFQNLDTLFDDFFDLSMPTFFVDPLFDGAAFGFDFEGLPLMGMDEGGAL